MMTETHLSRIGLCAHHSHDERRLWLSALFLDPEDTLLFSASDFFR